MHSYEIEVKSLLTSEEQAEILIQKMRDSDPQFMALGQHGQLNHYFTGGCLKSLFVVLKNHTDPTKRARFEDISTRAKEYSIRTRLADKDVLLVIKASVDDTSCANGTVRMEFEARMASLALGQLDEVLIQSGFAYQAKWSRERREFKYKGLHVSIDKNAGYGFLAEFEIQVEDPKVSESAKKRVRSIMKELDVEELPQDRLERMFDYYNKNWQHYYGTENTFNVE